MLAEAAPRVDHTFAVRVAPENPVTAPVVPRVMKNEKREDTNLLHVDLLERLNMSDALGAYLRQLDTIPLLSRDDELHLAEQIELGRAARETFVHWRFTHPDASIDRNEEMLQTIHMGKQGLEAEKMMVTSNLRLVPSIAKKYQHRGVSYLELIKEGNIGLLRAVKKYDRKRGAKFATYATWWVRQAIGREVVKKAGLIRVPNGVAPQIAQYKRLMEELYQQNEGNEPTDKQLATAWILEEFSKMHEGKEPTKEDIMKDMPSSLVKIHLLDQAILQQNIVSLEDPIDAHMPTGPKHSDVIVDHSPLPEEIVTKQDQYEQLEQQLKQLSQRDAEVLRMYFEEGMTYEAIGKQFNVSKVAIGQWIAKSIHTLSKNELPYYKHHAYKHSK